MLILIIINALAFVSYGILCITTNHMIEEFTRYGLLRFRVLTGYLEVLGGLGCIIGHFVHPYLFIFSCAGLAILMSMGVVVRLKVGDPYLQILPAFVLGCLNYYLVYNEMIQK